MDSASSGYPESTPNILHSDGVIRSLKIQLFTSHSQYPLSLLLLLLLRRSFSSANILREESLPHLENNDVFRWENFFNKVFICQRLTRITHIPSFVAHSSSLHRREGSQCCVLNKDNVHIRIALQKQRWRDAVRSLAKKVERRTHTIM